MKVYEIFLTDNYDNFYLIGFYKSLDDAIDEINMNIEDDRFKLEEGDLKEYASTFNMCFDTCLWDIFESKYPELAGKSDYSDFSDGGIWVRGFILDSQSLLNTLSELNNE